MKFLDCVSDILFPPKCIYCGELLPIGTRPMICRKCFDVVPLYNIRCGKCGGVITYNSGRPECLSCKAAGRYFDGVFAASVYHNNLRTAILKYKFGPQPYMAKTLCHFTVCGLKKLGISADFVLSVPPDPARLSRRGFDSTGVLAKHIAAAIKIPYKQGYIRKIKSTPAQSTLTHAQRVKNLKGAFALTSKASVKGRAVILVDDVFTTGSTVSEISRIIKKNGASYVFVVTIAKR